MAKSYLVLEDGSVFEGEPFGYRAPVFGEVVFSTVMSGYQENLTDPSSRGQIVVTTYPLVGNYGVNDRFNQSERMHARGLVVNEYCKEPSPMYGGLTLDDFLRNGKVPGISGIDTRDLTIKIRTSGTMKGAITEDKDGIDTLIKELKRMPAHYESNLVAEASCSRIEEHSYGKDVRIGLLDLGGKNSVIRDLSERFDITVFPYDTPSDVMKEHGIKGLVLSDGPGDPSHPELLKTAVRTVADLSAMMPTLGLCLGSQVVGVSMGGKTYKMKFGHRGSNQPVRWGNRVSMTAQNHGFAIDENSLDGKDLIVDQINVNDGTVEGFRHKDLPVFASQYHPEASPWAEGAPFMFDIFAKTIKGGRL
ncbi:MAG: glutamine-hydrolyzing carbamoyl-phosphate synthase small subunit [Candidatus Methanoplasma sp.]|jgi:carbamoyl-phosphate synthase small subunit|nr:glutamine-hydrolyzing carbamoyl-phosphate synthase small subunit [Candidatus Methanoplasma sp.]